MPASVAMLGLSIILGNEKADWRAAFESLSGVVAGSPGMATEEGLRAASGGIRRGDKNEKGMASEGAIGEGELCRPTPG